MDAKTFQQILGLSRMTVGELRETYLETFGEETRSFHKEFLRKRIAGRIQAQAEGTLSERARRRAEELANDTDLRIRTPRDPVKCGRLPDMERTTVTHVPIARDPRVPPAGTFLKREFKGRDIVVKVLDSGFEFEGRQYKSLSSIAKEITGTKWNGFLFFGVIKSTAARQEDSEPKRSIQLTGAHPAGNRIPLNRLTWLTACSCRLMPTAASSRSACMPPQWFWSPPGAASGTSRRPGADPSSVRARSSKV